MGRIAWPFQMNSGKKLRKRESRPDRVKNEVELSSARIWRGEEEESPLFVYPVREKERTFTSEEKGLSWGKGIGKKGRQLWKNRE